MNDWIFWAVEIIATLVIGALGFFLKGTINKNNSNSDEINDLKLNSATRCEIEKLSDKFVSLNDKYATKEEVREIKNQMTEMGKDIKSIKDETVKSGDFVRIMTRLEDKIDKLKEG